MDSVVTEASVFLSLCTAVLHGTVQRYQRSIKAMIRWDVTHVTVSLLSVLLAGIFPLVVGELGLF